MSVKCSSRAYSLDERNKDCLYYFFWDKPPGSPRRQCDNRITNDRRHGGSRGWEVDENGSGLYPVESFGIRGGGVRASGLLPKSMLNKRVIQ